MNFNYKQTLLSRGFHVAHSYSAQYRTEVSELGRWGLKRQLRFCDSRADFRHLFTRVEIIVLDQKEWLKNVMAPIVSVEWGLANKI